MGNFRPAPLSILLLLSLSCGSRQSGVIEFTEVPEASPGGAARTERIAGRVLGARKGQQIVLFARSGNWWVQPLSNKPFTPIQSDSTWSSDTHMGTEYAALLVEPGFVPPRTADALPANGGLVVATATVEGKRSAISPPRIPKTIHFSGYEWEVAETPSDSGGVMHANSPANAWTDDSGALHLRISKEGTSQETGVWNCAEIALTRSLGYGSYSFTVREGPALEPGTVLGMFTWDPLESGQNNREIDVELSQWGDPEAKNGQFTVQPYYVPANVFRFNVSRAALVHSFHWEPGRISFKTSQGPRVAAEHVFTSGIPSPGGERVHLNLYIFGKSRTPQHSGAEVVIEKFAYLP